MEDIKAIIAEYQSLNLQDVIHYDKFNRFLIVRHSCGIEGSTLTENEIRVLLEAGTTPKGKPLEHSLMVKDHYDALLFVLDAALKKQPVTVAFLQAINAKVMRHTGSVHQTSFGEIDGSKGMFRMENVRVGGSHFGNFEQVEGHTTELVTAINQDLNSPRTIEDQLHSSFIAHFKLVGIHPFYDGNGRTSRLLMNYLQAYYQLPLSVVYQEDKVAYYDTLQAARNQDDISLFTGFMVEQYKKYLLNEVRQFRKDIYGETP